MTSLVWGIKASLLTYVRGMTDGSVETAGAASERDGMFVFPAVDADEGVLRFSGSAVLTGHAGMMRVVIGEPWLVPADGGWTLTIADDQAAEGRMPFAMVPRIVDAPGGRRGEGATLTAEGADLFFGPYREGTPLDDPLVED